MEYEFAVETSIPVAAFLLHEEARKGWPQKLVEFEKRDKVNAFRALCETRMVKHWKNADDLGMKVIATLAEMTNRIPRIGWVRADSVASEAALREITSLSDERRRLQAQVEELQASAGELIAPADIEYRIRILSKKSAKSCLDRAVKKDVNSKMNLLDLFLRIYRTFASGAQRASVLENISKKLKLADRHPNILMPILVEYSIHNIITLESSYPGIITLMEYGKQLAMFAERAKSTKRRITP